MITTLTGNSFELKQARAQIIDKFVDQYSEMSVEKYDCESIDDPLVIHSALTNLPFLVSKKLVVLDRPSGNKQLAEKLLEWLVDSDSVDVILVEPHIDKRTAFYKFVQKQTDLKNFDTPKDWDIPAWIKQYAAQLGVDISPSAAKVLVQRVGHDQMQLARELEKLAINNNKIEDSDVLLLVDELPQSTVFDMLDALTSGSVAAALALYDKLIASKVDPAEILGMIGWQLHVLALIRTGGGGSLNPYVLRKNQPVANRLSLEQVREIVDMSVGAELEIKRGISSSSVDTVGLLLADIGNYLK